MLLHKSDFFAHLSCTYQHIFVFFSLIYFAHIGQGNHYASHQCVLLHIFASLTRTYILHISAKVIIMLHILLLHIFAFFLSQISAKESQGKGRGPKKITFSKKQYGFFTTLADPHPPGLAKDHKKFRTPSLRALLIYFTKIYFKNLFKQIS